MTQLNSKRLFAAALGASASAIPAPRVTQVSAAGAVLASALTASLCGVVAGNVVVNNSGRIKGRNLL
jgi:hypothetical protein